MTIVLSTSPTTTFLDAIGGWNRRVFDDLAALIGPVKAYRIAERFAEDLSTRFADVDDRDALRRDAHVIASTAGMLGFAALSGAARSLEAACQAPGAIRSALDAVVLARQEAVQSLATLPSQATNA